MVSRIIDPDPVPGPPQFAAVTVPRLEFLKLNRVNGTPLAEVDEANRRHGIYLARMPGVVFAGDSSARILSGIVFHVSPRRFNACGVQKLMHHASWIAKFGYENTQL